jgi:VanZ family protein
MKLFVRYWLPAIALCAIIFWQSCFATPDVLPDWPFQDKALHAGVYGLLGALWVRAFNTLKPWRGRVWPLLATGVVLATLYGLSDEWHQSFVPARSADGADLLADFIGSALGSRFYVRFAVERVSKE